MSEPMLVSINIGGQIKKRNVKKLIKYINESGMFSNWNETSLTIIDQKHLLGLLDKDKNMYLVDGGRNWGDIGEFEDQLKELGLTHRTWVGQTQEYMGELKFWSPGSQVIQFACDDKGEAIATQEDLREMAIELDYGLSLSFRKRLNKLLNPMIVPPFEII